MVELTFHLERKAAQLHREGLGRIKMALVGTNTSLLLEILEGSFDHVDLDTTTSSVSTETPIRKSHSLEKSPEKTSEVPEKASVPPTEEGSLASAEPCISLKIYPSCCCQTT